MLSKILKSLLFVMLLSMPFACPAQENTLIWQGTAGKTPIKFSFTKPADKYATLRIALNSAEERAVLEITSKTVTGKAVYESRVTTSIEGKNGVNQLFDRLSQMPGTYEVKITGQAASCSIFIEQLADLEPFIPGDELGELVVNSAGGVPVSVSPERFQIKHPDFKKGMDKGIATPNGDFIFRLPAGFWSLKRVCKGIENARMIAVSSGRRTFVRWASPPEISLESNSSGAARRIEIRNVEAETDNVLASSRFSLPAGLSTFTPAIDQLQAFERFLPAEIVDLKQSDTPLHLVMLLDSSGSMKKSMKAAIEASVKFIETLPADAVIELIDFDTKAKPVKANSRTDMVKALKAIKADGATALRDSILLGLDHLKNSPRPALVVFTDGFDANYNDTAPGSKASEKDVFAKVTGARIPIFTIGFGTGADASTLARLADLSGGVFQSADEKSLNEVFARLEATVAREYLLTYKRPQKAGRGIRPVISICVDTSGSMESNLQAGVIGSRREIAKQTLHSLIEQLPSDALVQILDFDANTEITQTATGNRARVHAGVGALHDGGGTNVVKAVEVALEGMLAVPSNRRYMLFLTDEAIRTANKRDEELLNRMLARMKDENIFSMWIGMVGKQG
ncbi:MAG: PEGA protein, partial [uncultured bacterium]